MTTVMLGPVVLLAALASPAVPAAEQSARRGAEFRPTNSATAYATARIRIVSGVRFGSSQLPGAAGANRRRAELVDADGLIRPVELLEFQ